MRRREEYISVALVYVSLLSFCWTLLRESTFCLPKAFIIQTVMSALDFKLQVATPRVEARFVTAPSKLEQVYSMLPLKRYVYVLMEAACMQVVTRQLVPLHFTNIHIYISITPFRVSNFPLVWITKTRNKTRQRIHNIIHQYRVATEPWAYRKSRIAS
jgi:hypothetical protein